MLKFQNNNTTVIATFEDFILTTYVIIDELYHQFALPEVAKRRHVLDAKLSDSEIITISPVFRRSTRKFPSFSSCHFFISFPASRFFLYLQQIFNALLGLFLLKKFF